MSDGDGAAARRAGKSPSAFRTTGEVAEELDLPPHVLRFWESKFAQLKPLKRSGGRRYYRPEDVVLLRLIRQWLYQDGYTIRGVQKLLRQGGGRDAGPGAPPDRSPEPSATLFALAAPPQRVPPPPRPNLRGVLEEVRQELLEIRTLLSEFLERG